MLRCRQAGVPICQLRHDHRLHAGHLRAGAGPVPRGDGGLPITEKVRGRLTLGATTGLFSSGVDSIMAVQIRAFASFSATLRTQRNIAMNYWLDLFTGTTWEEFQEAGANVTGFREHNRTRASRIRPGDVFLCYITGVKRWVGLLEVTGDLFVDNTPIWGEEVFPVRFSVRPLVMLTPECGVPMESLKGTLTFYNDETPPGAWSGLVRGSPTKYKKADGEAIVAAIREAEANPVVRAVDSRKLKRSSNLYKLKKKSGDEEVETVVAIPTTEEEDADVELSSTDVVTHTEIQWRLLDLGSQMGLSVWAPKADRNRSWNEHRIGDVRTF